MATLDLIGEMNDKSCNPIIARLATCNDDVVLRIDSPGGEVESGIRLAVALTRWADAHPENSLTIDVGTMACSMAANLLALAPERAQIVGYAASMLMYHSCRGFAEGTPEDMISAASYMGGINKQVIEGLCKRTGLNAEVFRPWFHGAEKWLTGKEAYEMGIFGGLVNGAAAIEPASLVALYKLAANANKTEGVDAMDEEKKPCADEILDEVKEEVIEEQIEQEPAPAPEEVVEEKIEADGEEEIVEAEEEKDDIANIIEELKSKVAELTEEVEALKETKAKLTAGLKIRKDAPKAVAEDWVSLVKTIPTACSPREYAEKYTALKKAHMAAFNAYMNAHNGNRKIR